MTYLGGPILHKILFTSLFFLILSLGLESGENKSYSSPSLQNLQQPHFEVSSLGAPVTGSLIEGKVGCLNKGSRQRFYCHSAIPPEGFLGPQGISEPVRLRDQPGIFPAPVRGPASVTFTFDCQDSNASVTPVIVRPDGTVFCGAPMSQKNSPQTIVISSPAQTGIYTLFAPSRDQDSSPSSLLVNASVSTQPQNNTSFVLNSFSKNSEKPEEHSVDFIYINSP